MALITMDAHVATGEVHDREPAFLTHDAIDDRLVEGLDSDELIDLLKHSTEATANEVEFSKCHAL